MLNREYLQGELRYRLKVSNPQNFAPVVNPRQPRHMDDLDVIAICIVLCSTSYSSGEVLLLPGLEQELEMKRIKSVESCS